MATELSQMDEILTAQECADMLKINIKTLYRVLSEEREPGKIFARKVGTKWRIKREEVMRYLSEEKPKET